MKWDYDNQFLPESVHTLAGFKKTMDLMTSGSYSLGKAAHLAPRMYLEKYILGLGMLLRELGYVQFTEELPENAPTYIGDSKASFACREELLEACSQLANFLRNEAISESAVKDKELKRYVCCYIKIQLY
jgi:hypothetical protein